MRVRLAMMNVVRMPLVTALALIAAGCAKAPQVVMAPPPPVFVSPPPPMPAGAYAGMPIPARLADGSYATPNRALSSAATVWHLRAALNVAALACRGPAEATIIARYNALLRTHTSTLGTAQTALSAEYRAGGGDWQDRYDDAMTRLYNFFSQSFARDAFCVEAARVLEGSAALGTAELPGYAAAQLASLDRPFTDFYAAYDAWRGGSARPWPAPVIAVAAAPAPVATAARPVVPAASPAPAPAVATRTASAAPTPAPTRTAPAPRLTLDLTGLQDSTAAVAAPR